MGTGRTPPRPLFPGSAGPPFPADLPVPCQPQPCPEAVRAPEWGEDVGRQPELATGLGEILRHLRVKAELVWS